jgi:hypothetical protein
MKFTILSISALSLLVVITSCHQKADKREKQTFSYNAFKDSILRSSDSLYDSTNYFDDSTYNPADTTNSFFNSLDTVLSQLKRNDSLSSSEQAALKENLAMLDSFYNSKEDSATKSCTEGECGLFVHIIKSRQIMYLYLDGELKDSFEISTGLKEYSTPELSMHPRGPIFTKYTSRKFPGGNYKGLGNMPYAVFVKGGYAIHGTTTGNFKKLGNQASHGCIRLHPNNARLFYEMVKVIGLKNTWVKVSEE